MKSMQQEKAERCIKQYELFSAICPKIGAQQNEAKASANTSGQSHH